MRTRLLGSTGAELSVIGFGTFQAGGGHHWGLDRDTDRIMEERNREAISAALSCGVNWIDSAEIYGQGRSERLVGEMIESPLPFLATKVAPAPDGSGLHPDGIRIACDNSLTRLGVDIIDLFQIHYRDDDDPTPLEESWEAMSNLVDEGLVRYIGLSHLTQPDVARCHAIRNVDSVQAELSPLESKERKLIEWCEEEGIGVVTYGPLYYGLLTGLLTADVVEEMGDLNGGGDWGWLEQVWESGDLSRVAGFVRTLENLSASLEVSVPQLALAWNIAQAGVTATLVGSRRPAHVIEDTAAGDIILSTESLDRIETAIEAALSSN